MTPISWLCHKRQRNYTTSVIRDAKRAYNNKLNIQLINPRLNKQISSSGIIFKWRKDNGVESHTHLGLTLSSIFSWKIHILNTYANVSKALNVLKTLKYKLNLTINLIVFIKVILDHIDRIC